MKLGQRVFSKISLLFMVASFCFISNVGLSLAASTEQSSYPLRRIRNMVIAEFLTKDQTGWRKLLKEKIIADLGEWAPERLKFVNSLVDWGGEGLEVKMRDYLINSYLKGECRTIKYPIETYALRETPEAILISLKLLEPWKEKEGKKKLIEKITMELLMEKKKVSGEKAKEKILEETQQKIGKLNNWWEYKAALERISHGNFSSAYDQLRKVIKSPPSKSYAVQAKVLRVLISCSRLDIYEFANSDEEKEWLGNLLLDVEGLLDEDLEIELIVPKPELEKMEALKEMKEEFARKLSRELENVNWDAFAKYSEANRKREIRRYITGITFEWSDVDTWSIPTWRSFSQVKEGKAFVEFVNGSLGKFGEKGYIYFSRGEGWNSHLLAWLSLYLDPVVGKIANRPPRIIKLLEEKKLYQQVREKLRETITSSE